MKTGSVYESLRKGCPFTAFPSAAQPALAGPLNIDAYMPPPPPKKRKIIKKFRETKNLLIFVVHRSAFVCCCLSRFLCGLLILDIFLARRSERSVIMSRRGAGFDGRLSLRLLNRGRLCATLRDSSRNSLCGQLIGRSVALSGARRTHC